MSRQSEQEQEMYELGLSLCLEAGAIEECEAHPGSYFQGEEEVVSAYKIAAHKVKVGEINLDQKAVTDAVKSAYDDNAGIDYCPSCDRNERD